MKGYVLDLHIGVKDAQYICDLFGHELHVDSISAHCFVHNWTQAKVDVCNHMTWKNLDQNMTDAFYERYEDELNKYDFFYCFYSPTFCLLYEKFNKPIIMHVPLRYEVPFTNDPIRWNHFNEYCRKGIDKGQIIPIVTNKYDKRYTNLFIERDFELVPNLCEYTNAKYTGKRKEFLYCSKISMIKDWIGNPNVISKDEIRGHSFQDIADFKALIYVPYSNTLTSTFEQYTANIPMFFPTKRFLLELRKKIGIGIMSELSFQQVNRDNSRSVINHKDRSIKDPNDYLSLETFIDWIDYHDFYDEEYFPHIIYYDSIRDLENKLISLDFSEISAKMKETNVVRRKNILNKWEKIFERIGG